MRAGSWAGVFGVPDLEMLGLALEGSLLVARAEVEEGMGCLDEATVTALEADATIPISRAWACCFLVSACEAVRDYRRAFEWCDRIAAFAERYGSRYMLGFCRSHYAEVYMWRGRWDEAEEQLEEAVRAYGASRPPFVSDPLSRLAELCRRRGDRERAESLCSTTWARAPFRCAGRGWRSTGGTHAAPWARGARAAPDPRSTAGSKGSRRSRSSCAPGRREARRSSRPSRCASSADLAERVGTEPLRAAADVADGLLAAAFGEHERAQEALRGRRRRLRDERRPLGCRGRARGAWRPAACPRAGRRGRA